MSKTDLELLQRAARVVGINNPIAADGAMRSGIVNGAAMMVQWNPLRQLDDALEIAAKLGFTISYGQGSICVSRDTYSISGDIRVGVSQATCRAIVQAVTGIEEAREAARRNGMMS